MREDLNVLESRRLHFCKKSLERLKKNGDMKAYRHAVNYVNYKENHILTPRVVGIELTNNCNLKCPNCPTPTSVREKGLWMTKFSKLPLIL